MIDLLFERLSAWAADAGSRSWCWKRPARRRFAAGADLHLYTTMVEHHASGIQRLLVFRRATPARAPCPLAFLRTVRMGPGIGHATFNLIQKEAG